MNFFVFLVLFAQAAALHVGNEGAVCKGATWSDVDFNFMQVEVIQHPAVNSSADSAPKPAPAVAPAKSSGHDGAASQLVSKAAWQTHIAEVAATMAKEAANTSGTGTHSKAADDLGNMVKLAAGAHLAHTAAESAKEPAVKATPATPHKEQPSPAKADTGAIMKPADLHSASHLQKTETGLSGSIATQMMDKVLAAVHDAEARVMQAYRSRGSQDADDKDKEWPNIIAGGTAGKPVQSFLTRFRKAVFICAAVALMLSLAIGVVLLRSQTSPAGDAKPKVARRNTDIEQKRVELEASKAASDEESVKDAHMNREDYELFKWSDKSNYDVFKPGQVHEYFCAETLRNKDQTALIVDTGSSPQQAAEILTVSYGQLYDMCKQVAKTLQMNYDVGFDAMVPLLFERGLEMVVGIYGVLLAGGAYVPLEPTYPRTRTFAILEQVAPTVALTVARHADKLSPSIEGGGESRWTVLTLERKLVLADIEIEMRIHTPCDLALSRKRAFRKGGDSDDTRQEEGRGLVYTFFTSGSTGKPKGVMCEHAGLRHRIEYMQLRYALEPGECTVLKHGYTFGLSEWEMFWPLAVGGTLIVPPAGAEKDSEYMFQLCAKQCVKTMFFVPSMLDMFLDYIQTEEKDVVDAGFQLNNIVTCGEPLHERTIETCFRLLRGVLIDNLYGPTEGSMTVWRVPRGNRLPAVPIGQAIDGIRCFPLDRDTEQARISPVGVPGEICFAGTFIARGYLGLPDETARVFNPDTIFAGEYPGERLYKTGDLAYWKPDGDMAYLGRADNQIKIRGFRVELGEIEAVVRRSAAVEAATVVLMGEGESKFIAAYVAPLTVDIQALRSWCASELPSYMVPLRFVRLERLPKTDRGKIDKKALPPISTDEVDVNATGSGFSHPPGTFASTDLEVQVVTAIGDALGKDPKTITMASDFMQIGGNSLLAGKVTSNLRKKLGIPMPGLAIYKNPTPAGLAKICAELQAEMEEAKGSSSETEAEEDGKRESKTMSADRFLAHLLTFVMMLQSPVHVMVLNATLVEVVILYYIYGYIQGATAVLLMSCLTWLLITPFFLLLELVLAVLVKHCLIGILEPGGYATFSIGYFKWLCSCSWYEHVMETVMDYFIGTPVLNSIYRALGAKIGTGVVINTRKPFMEPELVTIEDNVVLDDECDVTCSSVIDGELLLHPVHIGQGSLLKPMSVVGRGVRLPENTELCGGCCVIGYGKKGENWVTSGKIRPVNEETKPYVSESEMWLRVFIGAPLLMLFHTLANVPVYIVALVNLNLPWPLYFLAISVLAHHVTGISFVTMTILVKWIFLGKVRPGTLKGQGAWVGLGHWLVNAMIESRYFTKACSEYTNTEVLRLVYCLLGASIGSRVCMDSIRCRTPDLLKIADKVVFGARVSIHCEADGERQNVEIHEGANVLDTCMIEGGVVVGEGALLGSKCYAPVRHYFPPDSINTGNKNGHAIFLRKRGMLSSKDAALEAEAMSKLDSPFHWFWFNFWITIFALLTPLVSQISHVMPFIAWHVFSASPWTVKGPMYLCSLMCWDFVDAFLIWVIKWSLIGQFTDCDTAFFSLGHFKWTIWNMFKNGLHPLERYKGTELYNTFLRTMGTKIGKDVVCFGWPNEMDLITMGDRSYIGRFCDITCHTVEHMVLKMSHTRICQDSAMQHYSFLMPGGTLQEGGILFDHTQVLKGETVPEGEIWVGNPAVHVPLRRSDIYKTLTYKPAE